MTNHDRPCGLPTDLVAFAQVLDTFFNSSEQSLRFHGISFKDSPPAKSHIEALFQLCHDFLGHHMQHSYIANSCSIDLDHNDTRYLNPAPRHHNTTPYVAKRSKQCLHLYHRYSLCWFGRLPAPPSIPMLRFPLTRPVNMGRSDPQIHTLYHNPKIIVRAKM